MVSLVGGICCVSFVMVGLRRLSFSSYDGVMFYFPPPLPGLKLAGLEPAGPDAPRF